MDDASDCSPSPVLGEFHKLMQEFVSCINPHKTPPSPLSCIHSLSDPYSKQLHQYNQQRCMFESRINRKKKQTANDL
jgi:hypothetical protein